MKMKEVLVSSTSTSTTTSSGYPFHLMNEELGLILTDHQKKKKKNPEEASSSSSSWRWRWWPTFKPFLNGGAAAFVGIGCLQFPFAALYQYSAPVARLLGNEADAKHFLRRYKTTIKLMPTLLFVRTIRSAARLGSFEIIRRKAIAVNDGMPLTLLQEASCGLTAGVIGSYIVAPFDLAYLLMKLDATKPAAQHTNFRNIFDVLYRVAESQGVSTLWRNAGPCLKLTMAFDMGMLASYYPSLNYLKESRGFSERRAQLGASAISALFAAAGTLILNGPVLVVTGTPKAFYKFGPHVMVTWIILEEIRKLELSIGL